MIRAGLYVRVSTQKEAQQDSLEYQKEKGQVVADSLGAVLCETYVDDGKSGTKVKGRTEYQRMVADIKENKLDLIITKDVDRLNRDLLGFCKMLDLSLRNNVKIYFYLTHEYYRFDNDTLIKIKAVLAEDYSKSLSVKANESHKDRQTSGRKAVFTNATWGYKTVYNEDGTTRLVIDENEAEMIRIIFDLCIQGFGVHKIAKKLFAMGYKNHHNNILGKSVILQILKNPKVTGTVIFNRRSYDFAKKETIHNPENEWIIKENVVPQIISKEKFELANSILNSRKFQVVTDDKPTRDYFKGASALSGKLVCGGCGSVYSRQVRKLGSGGRIYDWACGRYRSYGRKTPNQYKPQTSRPVVRLSEAGCDNPMVKQEIIYKVLFDLKETYFGSDNRFLADTLTRLKKAIEQTKGNDPARKKVDRLQQEADKLNEKINALTEKMIENIISPETYKNMVKKSEMERDSVHAQLITAKAEYAKRNDLEKRIKEIEAALEAGSMKEATIQGILDYIDKIYIFEDRFEIVFYMDKLIGAETRALAQKAGEAGKIVYPVSKEEMKYKRNAMDKTNEIIYNAIKGNSRVSIEELSSISGLSRTTVHFRIKRFKELGIIGHPEEAGRKREWQIRKEWSAEEERKLLM